MWNEKSSVSSVGHLSCREIFIRVGLLRVNSTEINPPNLVYFVRKRRFRAFEPIIEPLIYIHMIGLKSVSLIAVYKRSLIVSVGFDSPVPRAPLRAKLRTCDLSQSRKHRPQSFRVVSAVRKYWSIYI